MTRLQEIINTAKGFKYSINLEYDLNDPLKIENYIPTDKAMKIMNDIVNGFIFEDANRSHILLGSYGTGKSHLTMVLASLLSKKINKIDNDMAYTDLFYRISNYKQDFANNISQIISEKYLIVLPEEGLFDFEQSIILGLKKALKNQGLESYLPKTFYDTIIEKIEFWAEDFPTTYHNLKEILQNEYELTLKEFISGIKKYDKNYYHIFLELHPKLTAGSKFTPYNRVRLVELLSSIESVLKNYGYKGVLIAFDEFGKFLEENIDNFNIKDIQDLAEYCNDESNKLNTSLLLITHKNLAQYTTNTKEMTEEWRKVEGRFKRHNITKHSKQIYELISKVIIKTKDGWQKFKELNKENFKDLMFYLQESNLFVDLTLEELKDWILFGCYPLHPATAFGLFNLSKLIAQNERTLFTFLSQQEKYGLNYFLKEADSDFPLVGLDQLYDYFLDLIKQEDENSRIYGVWKKAHRSLQKLNNDEEVAKRFIKSLAVINIISKFSRLAPTPENIRNNLGLNRKKFKEVEKLLLEKKVIFYRKSLNHYKFFDGSDLNIKAKIKEVSKSRNEYFDPIVKLNQNYLLSPVLAHRYNFKNNMLRFFTSEYLNIQDITKEKIRGSIQEKYLDGKIFIILPSSQNEIKEARKRIQEINHKQAIFLLPKEHMNWKALLSEIDSIEYLLTQKDFLAQDPIIKLELEFHLEEKQEQLLAKLNQIYHPTYNQADFYYQGKKIKLKDKKELSKLISEICKEVFTSTMIINHEMINRNQITGIMKKVRKDIIKKLLSENDLQSELGFSNFTAAHTVVRSVLVKNDILKEVDNQIKIVVPETIGNGQGVVQEIKQFIAKAKDERVNFKNIYDNLQSAPYGLRKGYLPILLSAYLRKYRGRIVITKKDEDREIRPAIFDEIEENPQVFKLGIDLWDDEKESYILNLEKIFNQYIDDELKKRNRLKALWEGMKKYYRSLPHYTRNTNSLAEETMMFKKILNRDFKNTHQLYFEIFPNKLSENDFNKLADQIENIIYKLNQALDELYSEIVIKLNDLNELKVYNSDTIKGKFFNWYQQLPSKIKNHHFNWQVNSIFDLIKDSNMKDNKEFINELAERLTGFTPAQWRDEHLNEFLANIKEMFIEINDYNQNEKQHGEVKLSFIQEGSQKELSFNQEEVSDLGEMLLSKVKTDFDNFGHSISNKEKLTILFELLKEQL
ncbi:MULTISPECIES: hypothetical protein [unclassified Candidatus Frackibacter]|uniref:hypothetical protein n=1 Tax=unclassified Candidatus Frackibacter TaxID=2648818 RepID=UPI00088D23CA|nr:MULTISPECIES: hypothetical protein [unclassified Candidatus Frackibacter]SDC27755.1 hypothetical protein SAMN04515661_10585 [Candidatus Frackibacter sp. WG11]SEM54654.1 hypothetical protein SAMN04488698_10686 [Candidatus Frackibacter sp. WG12]SFL53709.1 hypothetical protein SAMN04488699_1058 [Candidatus Frackibacter sp. WG13]